MQTPSHAESHGTVVCAKQKRACPANKCHVVASPMASSDPHTDAVVQLCTTWQVLCLARTAGTDAVLLEHHRQASPDSDEDSPHEGYSSASSCSSAASLAETVVAQTSSYRKHVWGDVPRSRMLRPTELGGGEDLRFMVHSDLHEDDESSEMDSSDGELEAERWQADQCDAAHYRRFEHVNLVLPASIAEKVAVDFGFHDHESQRFWDHTASNLEKLTALGLVERYSLVVRSGQGGELAEVEMDMPLLRSAHEHIVCGLRILADVDTLHAHCADCARCATNETEDWNAWWGRALCLAEYTSFLANASRVRVPCNIYDDQMQLDLDRCDLGCDLAFLAD